MEGIGLEVRKYRVKESETHEMRHRFEATVKDNLSGVTFPKEHFEFERRHARKWLCDSLNEGTPNFPRLASFSVAFEPCAESYSQAFVSTLNSHASIRESYHVDDSARAETCLAVKVELRFEQLEHDSFPEPNQEHSEHDSTFVSIPSLTLQLEQAPKLTSTPNLFRDRSKEQVDPSQRKGIPSIPVVTQIVRSHLPRGRDPCHEPKSNRMRQHLQRVLHEPIRKGRVVESDGGW